MHRKRKKNTPFFTKKQKEREREREKRFTKCKLRIRHSIGTVSYTFVPLSSLYYWYIVIILAQFRDLQFGRRLLSTDCSYRWQCDHKSTHAIIHSIYSCVIFYSLYFSFDAHNTCLFLTVYRTKLYCFTSAKMIYIHTNTFTHKY